jgi:alanyl aminopeptidase
LYGARARTLGLAPKAGEDEDAALLRPLLIGLVADQGEDAQLRAQTIARAHAWLADKKAIDAEMAQTVLSAAARVGDERLYDAFLAEARRTPERLRRNRLLRALSQFRQPALVARSLGLVLEGGFDLRESQTLLFGALATPGPRQQAYDFVKQRFDELVARGPHDYGAGLSRVGAAFCDEPHAADLEQFFGPRAPRYTGGPRLYRQALEDVRLCAARRARQATSVRAFLEQTE